MTTEKDFACADCGREQDSMDRPCDWCASRRVVLISMIVSLFGEDWKKHFVTCGWCEGHGYARDVVFAPKCGCCEGRGVNPSVQPATRKYPTHDD